MKYRFLKEGDNDDFIICPECGWEDDGTDRIDELTLPNGDYTIRSCRKKYLKEKGKRT